MGNHASHLAHEQSAPAKTGRPVIPAEPLPASFVNGLKEQHPELHAVLQLPGTDAYLHNNVCWNWDAQGSPSGIIVPENEEQVSTLIKFYGKNPLPEPHSISISGGRHSHYGLKTHALVIDMTKFTKTEMNKEKMTGKFGSGLRLRQFDSFCKSHGVATTAGTNPDTGIAGLTLGGGFGYLSRRHGFAADNLVSARMVLYDGRIVEARDDNEFADVFWSIRGGGGNFGIITEFEFKVYPRGDIITGATVFLTRKFTNVHEVMQKWRDYNRTAPRDVISMCILPTGGPLVLPTAYIGDKIEEEGWKMLEPVRAIGSPMINSFEVQPYCDGLKPGKDLQSAAADKQQPGNWYEGALVIKEMSDEAINTLLKYTADIIPNKTSQIVITPLGGRINDFDVESSAIGWRRGEFVAILLAKWECQHSTEAYVAERNKCREWMKSLISEMGPHVVARYNTLGEESLDTDIAAAAKQLPVTETVDTKSMSAWTETQYKKLVAVKAKYDPSNFFTNCNNIKVPKANN